MINTFLLATNGIGPGFTVFNVALNGLGFQVQIEIKGSGGGGGAGPRAFWEDADKYTIIIRIHHKGKVWEEQRKVSRLMGKSLEKVVATFRSAKRKMIDVIATINTMIRQSITFTIGKKK